jgi:SAM-dependent methyltransferase
MTDDPYAALKAAQREGWGLFAPIAPFTTPAAAALVNYAAIKAGEAVLDVACGTGVVAITAAVRGAAVNGLDLSPALLDDARRNAMLVDGPIEFREGDVEALPYADASFDVVLSQFGHMFAPRPERAVAEMLRVLKPGGRIAFSTWPPELCIGRLFDLVGRYLPGPPGAAAPSSWGETANIRRWLGDAVTGVEFSRDEMTIPALSPRHYGANMEHTAAPFIKVIQTLADQPDTLAAFRGEVVDIVKTYFVDNRVRQSYLITRAVKR